MPLSILLGLSVALLTLGLYAITVLRRSGCSRQIYSISLVMCVILLGLALAHLLSTPAPVTLTLPLGLPWLGVHFRLDALSAFFLIVVNLGGAVASLFALGYGQHERAPERVLPFYPAFLAGMNLVLLA
ncbi:MAG: hydrogenase 4 subunit B, partial [Candidatus Competibacteraceae bacterium]|nr:hydrogenase 4 subunit B [Candidatus Competibacteraceae bacterium]